MLDNFSPETLHPAAARVKAKFPAVIIEGSGGITAATLPKYFGPDVDVLSIGALTQGYSCLDFSMKIDKGGGSAAAYAARARSRL